jgi:hypothetical protein
MFSNPIHRKFMNLVDNYYDHPFLQKVRDQDDMSTYMCKISSLLLNENRYLVAIASKDDHPVGHVQALGDISWKYFQARVLEGNEYVSILGQSYVTKRDMSWPIVKVKSTKEYSVFVDETGLYPVEVTLLHTSSDEYEYPSRGTFAACLETYQTMVRFVDE